MPIYKMTGRRDGKQKYRVRINFIDLLGKKRQIDRVVYGAEEAKLLELQLKKSIKDETPSKGMTFSELFEEYCTSRRPELRESTLEKTRKIILRHVMPTFHSVQIRMITAAMVRRWKTQINQQDLSIHTKQNIYGAFRTVLNYAVQMEYLSTNVLVKIGNFKQTLQIRNEMGYYTPDEFKKFISAAKANAEKYDRSGILREWDFYVFFAVAFYTGMRKGEIHALEWRDIKDGYIHIARSITQKLRGADRETAPKNKSSVRSIQIPVPLMEILDEHRKRWNDYSGFNDRFKVCGGIQCLRDTSIENHNKLFSSESGVKKIRIHDFRHSHASILANNGINIQEIARRLGHSNVEITWNTYSHLYPKEEERATKILDKIV